MAHINGIGIRVVGSIMPQQCLLEALPSMFFILNFLPFVLLGSMVENRREKLIGHEIG